jgi:phage gp36-like protein
MAVITRYAEIADIVTIYDDAQLALVAPRIVDEETEEETVDEAAVNRALDEASTLIDSYIARIVTLPFDGAIPKSLRRPCVDITLYMLAMDPLARTDEHRRRYEDAIKWLQGVAKGDITLGPYDVDGDGGDDENGEEVPRARTGLFTIPMKRG